MIAESSDWRPWNIFGSDGNNDREFELGDIRMSLIRDGPAHLCWDWENALPIYETWSEMLKEDNRNTNKGSSV
jgi:hypothetical protein